MENTLFGFVLFGFIYGFLFWLTNGGSFTASSTTAGEPDFKRAFHTTADPIEQACDDDAPVIVEDSIEVEVPETPIDQQLQDVLSDDHMRDESRSTSAQEIDRANSSDPHHECAGVITEAEVNSLTLRQAQKMAKMLGIQQSVKGDTVRKGPLIAQIKGKMNTSAATVKRAFDEVMSAAS